jgi:hypothetical protein
MSDSHRLAIVLATVLVVAPARSGAGDRVVVAWDTPAIQGRVAALDTAPPYPFATPELAVGADGLVRVAFGRVYHLSRTSGALTVIDPESWTPAQSFALGAGSEPRDIAVIDADTAYVSRRGARYLWRLDLGSGAKVDAVDLAPLGAGDGNPAMDTMLVRAGRLYLQLAGEPGSGQPHALAVIDLASETLVDADPVTAGIQGIALLGTGPRFKMQRVPRSNRLMVSATGAFHDLGGFELIDLDALVSLGLVVREQEEAGADAGAFTMVDAQRGWLVFSTDLLLSSHLHAFTLTGGIDPSEADVSLDYFAPHLVYHPASNTLFWPEPDGVQPFDATTGAPRAGPTLLDGLPTDLELLTSALGIPLPEWAPIALGVLLAAATLSRGRRSSRTRAR